MTQVTPVRSGTTELHHAESIPSRKSMRVKSKRRSARGLSQNSRALLGAVEAGQKGAEKKAWPLRSARALSFERRNQQGARVDGGPVDERRRREPRAHRFQAVESTSVVEQPSPFAGWRSVGGLHQGVAHASLRRSPWVKGGDGVQPPRLRHAGRNSNSVRIPR